MRSFNWIRHRWGYLCVPGHYLIGVEIDTPPDCIKIIQRLEKDAEFFDPCFGIWLKCSTHFIGATNKNHAFALDLIQGEAVVLRSHPQHRRRALDLASIFRNHGLEEGASADGLTSTGHRDRAYSGQAFAEEAGVNPPNCGVAGNQPSPN